MDNEKKSGMKKDKLSEFISQPLKKAVDKIPLYASRVPAGFPSPADDFLEKQLDLNDYIGGQKASVFLIRVQGYSMENAGIFDGDILVVDKALEAVNGKIVLGVLNGEFTVKRLSYDKEKLFLVPENKDFQPIEVTEEMDFKIWGVVTFAVHAL